MTHWVDTLSDDELNDPRDTNLVKLKQAAKEKGMDLRAYLKSIIPDPPLPLTKAEMEYGRRVAKRLWRKGICSQKR